MIQIPKNRIVTDQYTNGTGIGKNLTLRFTRTKIPYIGFYNIVNGSKYFTGKDYTEQSKPLEKYNIIQTATAAIAAVGSIPTIAGALTENYGTNNTTKIRYFYKDLTKLPVISIKEIDQNAYNELAGPASMTYQVISYNSKTQTIEEVNKQMPGLIEFLVT
jgi:hypothetical protein